MTDNGLSASDIALLQNNDGGFGGSGSWVFFLFFLLAWGGNGLGFGNRGESYEVPATKDYVSNQFNNQNVINKLNGLESGLCDGFYSMNNSVKENGYATRQEIDTVGHQLQDCCCKTQRAIDNVNFNNSKNTCDIINAGNANTQRIIDTMNNYAMEQKDIKIAEQAQLLSEQRIVNTINSSLQPPRPIPAYAVANPYCNYGGTGNCGCGNLYA